MREISSAAEKKIEGRPEIRFDPDALHDSGLIVNLGRLPVEKWPDNFKKPFLVRAPLAEKELCDAIDAQAVEIAMGLRDA